MAKFKFAQSLDAGNYEFRRAHKGADTRLSFEDGSTLLLKGVTKSEFETYLDFLPDM